MEDKEIIKGLESHLAQRCGNCPYDNGINNYCITPLMKDALDLINRQQAEIERLTDRNKRLGEGVGLLLNNENGIELIRAEAIKEFAERLKEKAKPFLAADILGTDDVDNLVKEMVGTNNESND